MRPLVTFGVALALAGATAAGAQSRPGFAGEWSLAPDSSTAARPSVAATGDAAFRRGDMGSGWGSSLTIAQSADSLVVTFTHFSAYDLQPKLRYAYALNGAESVNSITIGHAAAVQRSRIEWNGASLVIRTQHAAPPGPDGKSVTVEVRQALALDGAGRLVIETTRGSVTGGAPTTVRASYNRR